MTTIDVPRHLVELLFLRDVWAISVPDGPPSSSSPPDPAGLLPEGFSPEGAAVAWWELWTQGIGWQPDGFPPTTFPPSWRERHGPTGVDEQARDWVNDRVSDVQEMVVAAVRRPRTAQLLAQAQERGLSSILALPLDEHWASRTEDGRLMVSARTLADEDRLADTLIGQG